MTPEEFETKMADIFANPDTDAITKSVEASDLMCEVLDSLGFSTGTEIYKKYFN